MTSGHVFWLFGLSGAGKTTLATGLEREARARGSQATLMLDGDDLRSGLCRDLGFTDEARTENIRRAAEVARLARRQGQLVVAAFITPREELRTLAKEIIGPEHVDLVWVDAPLAVCRRRDPKGLYHRSDAGTLPLFTGMQSIFEAPLRCDLRLRTDTGSQEELGKILWKYCQERMGSRA
jgi:adenylyl-sulfate kinase